MVNRNQNRPFAVWVIFAGLIFSGADLLYGIIPDLRNLSFFDPFIGVVGCFVLFCFISALGVLLTRRRWSFVLSIVVGLGFVVPSLLVFPNPSQFGTFAIASSSIPILVLVALFSFLCLLNLKTGLDQKTYLRTPLSYGGLLTAAVLILIIGTVTYGSVATAKYYTNSSATVSIVPGASRPTNAAGHFSPQTILVVIGVNNTVTWVNHDYTIHTVTSRSGIFDSGLLNSGDRWSYTFETAGNFSYYCSIHPYMTGIVIVEDP